MLTHEYYEGDEEDPFMDRHKKRKTEKGIILYTVNMIETALYVYSLQTSQSSLLNVAAV